MQQWPGRTFPRALQVAKLPGEYASAFELYFSWHLIHYFPPCFYTQGLANNPKDSAQLQEGVMRFAAQSAAFGVDTAVAERCVLTFLTD